MPIKAYLPLPLFRSQGVQTDTKIKVYKTIIELHYGCQTWIMTKKTAGIINAVERQLLTHRLGPVQENGLSEIRYIASLYEKYKEIPASKFA